ncbi:MAG TPA: M15 family metallopeptidase [Promicromonospora sp.]|nr:M15 family metallopeptidase [Promicromonospora sp.]
MAQISKSQCIELQSNPGYYLERDAAYAWDRACAEFGKQVIITGAWRSYETQVQIFDSEKHPSTGRYVRGNRAGQRGYTADVRGREADGSLYRGSWWTRKAGTAAAAVPGTSNHGSGRAVDVKTRREKGDPGHETAVIFAGWNDEDRKRWLRIAAKHGWADDEGRSVGEHWHQTYYPERDQHRGEKPKKTIQEDQMSATTERQIDELHAKLLRKFADGEHTVDVVEGQRRNLIVSRRIESDTTQLLATNRAQAAAIEALAKSVGVDPKVITATVEKSIDKALADLKITLSTEVE